MEKKTNKKNSFLRVLLLAMVAVDSSQLPLLANCSLQKGVASLKVIPLPVGSRYVMAGGWRGVPRSGPLASRRGPSDDPKDWLKSLLQLQGSSISITAQSCFLHSFEGNVPFS